MTKLKYLDNTYLYKYEVTFREIKKNKKGKAVILNETIFYPQGGGQPSDTGEIISGENTFFVNDVRLDESGEVNHFGDFRKGSFKMGDKVILKIDKDRRIFHARLHSAGHLLDSAVSKLKIENLQPIKGHHFKDGSHVEYNGTVSNPAEIIPALQKCIDELIEQDIKLEKKDITAEEVQTKGILAPLGKPARVVNFEGFAMCGCGGTHINTASEIGRIIIKKIKSRKGKTKISYYIS